MQLDGGNQAEGKSRLSLSKGDGKGNWLPRISVRVDGGRGWEELLGVMAAAFTAPSFDLFRGLMTAWVLLPGRHTITRMWQVVDEDQRHAHDAYHRFVRCARWRPKVVWRLLAWELVRALCPTDDLLLVVDDSLLGKTGRKISGAGWFRDAVRSTGHKIVHAWGLNVVLLTLRVRPPWGGEPLGLPINLRLYRKNSPKTRIDLTEEMVREVAQWFPDRHFQLCGDGAYASLAGRKLPRNQLTSRIRKNAALYELPKPRRKGQRGRPAKKGARLPSLAEIAAAVPKNMWQQAEVKVRGKKQSLLLYARKLLWYETLPDRQVLLVIVRDPAAIQPDDYFFTTDLDATAASVVSNYAGRWCIEDTFRGTKQFLGAEDPQTRKGDGPERVAVLSFLIYASVWLWYIRVHGTERTWPLLPWYSQKRTPSFLDAMAALRRSLWHQRIFAGSGRLRHSTKIPDVLLEALSTAA